MRRITCTTADNRFDKGLGSSSEDWKALVERLRTPILLDRSASDIDSLPLAEKANLKDRGWYLPGKFEPLARRKSNLLWRSAVTLDLDHCPPWLEAADVVVDLHDELKCVMVAHSTFSHRPGAPRYRLVIPLLRNVTPESYEPLARFIAGRAIKYFDATTFQPARVMFWPVIPKDVEYEFESTGGDMLDPEKYLSSFPGWRDWQTWPRHPGEQAHPPAQEVKPAWEKGGVIGAFCRAFTVEEAIAKWSLPYEQVQGSRWRYADGKGVAGVVIYETTGHLYSWHESDPARGNQNAFDLVRLHRHKTGDEDGPVNERPSQAAMVAEAMALPEVLREMPAFDDFDTVVDETPEEKDRTLDKVMSMKTITPGERRELVLVLAAQRMSGADESAIAGEIRKRHTEPRPDKAAIAAEIKRERKRIKGRQEADIDERLISLVLDRRYDGGRYLRRFARQFWRYREGVWAREEDERVRDSLNQTIIDLRADPKAPPLLRGHIEETLTSHVVSRVWSMFASRVSGLDDSGDPMGLLRMIVDPVMNCRNGELHFKDDGSFSLVAHRPEHMRTSQLAMAYDREADTQYWDNFCDHLFTGPDAAEHKRHLEEVAGYVLQPWREIACFFLLRGEPHAGKSTFGTLINLLLGASSVNRDLERYGGNDSHDTAGLVGKLLLLDDDFRAGGLLPDGFLRKISEAKQITANPKNKDTFDFVCRAAPMVFCNAWPALREHSGAIERRALVWNMPAFPKEARNDKERRRLLTAGLPGAFRCFVDGFARLYARGGFAPPAECIEAKESWLSQADSVAAWAKECLEEDEDSFLPRAVAYSAYLTWHRDSRAGGHNVGKQEFYSRMTRLYGEAYKRKDYGWRGLSMRDEEVAL